MAPDTVSFVKEDDFGVFAVPPFDVAGDHRLAPVDEGRSDVVDVSFTHVGEGETLAGEGHSLRMEVGEQSGASLLSG